MDRLVKADVKEVNLVFTRGQKCSTTFRLTNLMHTMAVAVSVSTTSPSVISVSPLFSIVPPLGTLSFTLMLSKPSDHPPLSTPPENVIVQSSMLPIGKASQEELRRLFSKPGRHIFKDVTIPVSFVGPHVIEFVLLTSSFPKTLEIAFVLSKAVSWCDRLEIGSLLRLAAMKGNGYVVSSLIDAGADVNNHDINGESLMSLAVKSGDIDTIRVLIGSCYVIDRKDDRLLHIAASANRVDVLEVLCMGYLDIDVNSVDSEGRTALHVGAGHGYVEVLRFLVSLGGDPDRTDKNRWTPLHWASVKGHVETVEFLLNSGTYVKNAITKEGKTAYGLALENGHSGLYDMLHLGDALQRAARKGDVEGIESCLSRGANVNGLDQNGWGPLHKTAFKGHIKAVKVLLGQGARVDLVDGMGCTPLHRAVEAGHAPIAVLLIAHGAKGNLKSVSVPFDLHSGKKCGSQVSSNLAQVRKRFNSSSRDFA